MIISIVSLYVYECLKTGDEKFQDVVDWADHIYGWWLIPIFLIVGLVIGIVNIDVILVRGSSGSNDCNAFNGWIIECVRWFGCDN